MDSVGYMWIHAWRQYAVRCMDRTCAVHEDVSGNFCEKMETLNLDLHVREEALLRNCTRSTVLWFVKPCGMTYHLLQNQLQNLQRILRLIIAYKYLMLCVPAIRVQLHRLP